MDRPSRQSKILYQLPPQVTDRGVPNMVKSHQAEEEVSSDNLTISNFLKQVS